jgi:hypothetical protein
MFSSGAPTPGGLPNLTAIVTLTNTGAYDGDEVVQVYVSGAAVAGLPTVRHNLAGFAKVRACAQRSQSQQYLKFDIDNVSSQNLPLFRLKLTPMIFYCKHGLLAPFVH